MAKKSTQIDMIRSMVLAAETFILTSHKRIIETPDIPGHQLLGCARSRRELRKAPYNRLQKFVTRTS